jgi:hypothetical protein
MTKATPLSMRLEALETQTRAHLGEQDEYIEKLRDNQDDRMTALERRVKSVELRQRHLADSMRTLRRFVRAATKGKG